MEKYNNKNKLTLNERLKILFTRSEYDKIVLSKSLIFFMYFIYRLLFIWLLLYRVFGYTAIFIHIIIII